MKAGRGIYDRDDVLVTIEGRRGQRIDTRKPESGIVLTSAVTYMGEIKARSFSSSWQESLMVFTRFLSLWSPR